MKKLFAGLCAALLIALLAFCATAEESAARTLRIIATSDLHGKFVPWDYALNEASPSGSLAQLATAICEYRTEDTLLVDAGDTLQDNSADIFLGDGDVHPMIQGINALEYDVWVTGNHEYDYGMDVLKKAIRDLIRDYIVSVKGGVIHPRCDDSWRVTGCIIGEVASIGDGGLARLDITAEDFRRAGFERGDTVTVTAGSYTGEMPCYDGDGVDRGGLMPRVASCGPNIALCAVDGSFAEMAGVAVGDPVTITMKRKGRGMPVQKLNDMSYTDNRADFASDAAFANFRPVVEGKLYRSASPVDNRIKRARYADALICQAGVRTVMNLSDTHEAVVAWLDAEDFDSPYYRDLFEGGDVITLGLGFDYTSDEFLEGLVKGFSFLAERDAPYLVHCVEGKDRAGFAAMLLEALMGWSEAQIVSDYMLSYTNYYGIEPGTEKYDAIAERNARGMLRTMARLDKGASLAKVDLKAAAEGLLLSFGMSDKTLKQLEAKLASE